MVVLGFIKLGSVGYLGLYRTSASEIYSSYHNLSPPEVLLLDLIQNLAGDLFLFRRICKDCTSILSAKSQMTYQSCANIPSIIP